MGPQYQPYYCEENVWWCVKARGGHALFISNAARQVAMLHQRAAPVGELVVWDYHVVALVDGEVHDPDTRLAMPLGLASYLAASFPPGWPAPRFRVVAAAEFIAIFSTDRSHMRDRHGAFTQPPPPWEPPRAPGHDMNLMRFVDMSDDVAGEVLDAAALVVGYSSR
jgi:hypothetical protein